MGPEFRHLWRPKDGVMPREGAVTQRWLRGPLSGPHEGASSPRSLPDHAAPQPILGDSPDQPLPLHSAGSPKPTIHWSKLRSPLPWQHRLEGDTLIIPRVAQQDSGQYICNASSPAGHAEATVVLHVESKALARPPQATVSALHGGPSAPHHPQPGSTPVPDGTPGAPSGGSQAPQAPGACPPLARICLPGTWPALIRSPRSSASFGFAGPFGQLLGPSVSCRPDLCVSPAPDHRPALRHHRPGARLGASRGGRAAAVPGSRDAPADLPVEPRGWPPPGGGHRQERAAAVRGRSPRGLGPLPLPGHQQGGLGRGLRPGARPR